MGGEGFGGDECLHLLSLLNGVAGDTFADEELYILRNPWPENRIWCNCRPQFGAFLDIGVH